MFSDIAYIVGVVVVGILVYYAAIFTIGFVVAMIDDKKGGK